MGPAAEAEVWAGSVTALLLRTDCPRPGDKRGRARDTACYWMCIYSYTIYYDYDSCVYYVPRFDSRLMADLRLAGLIAFRSMVILATEKLLFGTP